MNIGIFIYDDAEVLDFSGPFEVFSTANRLVEGEVFNVFLISEKSQPVNARGGFSVLAKYNIDNHPVLDTLIVAGGVHDKQLENSAVIRWITQQNTQVNSIAAVCTGVFLLAQAQVLTEHKVTTHWGDIDQLRDQFPALQVMENVRWVDQGRVVTSAGISAGIDMSLHLVSKLYSEALAIKTARQMEFDRQTNP
ncbi:MAG: DJ-1/PfpI family protein [Oceanospirillaceae bacterium]|nr:DJ-1/PfpI family protein [Oceanospirillaceae bacterium]